MSSHFFPFFLSFLSSPFRPPPPEMGPRDPLDPCRGQPSILPPTDTSPPSVYITEYDHCYYRHPQIARVEKPRVSYEKLSLLDQLTLRIGKLI